MNAHITRMSARTIGISVIIVVVIMVYVPSVIIVVVIMVYVPYNSFGCLLHCNLLLWFWFWGSYNNPLNSNTFSIDKPSPKSNLVSEICSVHLRDFS